MQFEFKVLLFVGIAFIAFRIATYRIRYANEYFREIRKLKSTAHHLREVNMGIQIPKRHEQDFRFMSRYDLEVMIRDMFIEQGFEEIGLSEWSRYMRTANYRTENLPYSNESVIHYFNDNKDFSPSPTAETVNV